MMKYFLMTVIVLSGMNLFGQVRNFEDIPKDVLEQLDKMGVDSLPLLTASESDLLNFLFKDDRNDFDFTAKKVGFILSGTKTPKNHYFSMQKKHYIDKDPSCDNGTLFILDTIQKEESGGYDAAVVYWRKMLIRTEDVLRILKTPK